MSPSVVHHQALFAQVGDSLSTLAFYDMVNRTGGRQSEDWHAQSATPGAQPFPSDIALAQPGKFEGGNPMVLCSFCRQGDTFYPLTYLPTGVDPKVQDGPYGFDPSGIHLYHDGQEVQPGSVLGITTYPMPAESARYQLVANTPGTTTTWNFTSAAPASTNLQPGVACVASFAGLSDDPCEPDPLPFLRYNAHTDLANTVTAAAMHQLDVTAYHQADDAPAISSVKVWTSVDGGKTWQPAALTGGSNGSYTATYTVPALSGTDGAVSIKAQATDAGGNTIDQTLINSVKLAAR